MDVFVTGVTGFVGRYVAVRMLDRRPDVRLWCLVRADDAEHGRQRLQRSLDRAAPGRGAELVQRVEPVVGDLTEPGLGLSDDRAAAVVAACASYLHAAADVRFNQPLEDARERNVQGTARVVELVRRAQAAGHLERLDWVGTAFVAGLRRDVVAEDELEHEAGWKNSYEQSKFEAERWLRAEASDLPLTVFRPSIVVGDSSTGATTNFGMLYWPLKLYGRGWWRTVVGSPETPVDIVPVDFVADCIEYLSRPGRPVGGAYHVAAGQDGCRTIEQLGALAQSYFGGPPPKYMDPKLFMTWIRPVIDAFLWGRRGRTLKGGGQFFIPYFSGNPVFDTSRLNAELEGSGVVAPTVEEYLARLLDYAVKSDFGRIPAEG